MGILNINLPIIVADELILIPEKIISKIEANIIIIPKKIKIPAIIFLAILVGFLYVLGSNLLLSRSFFSIQAGHTKSALSSVVLYLKRFVDT